MNNWSSVKDVKFKLLKIWQKGRLLQSDSKQLFPLKIKLKSPNAKQLPEQFSACQQWVKKITPHPLHRIEWREINHKKLGKNTLPCAIVFDTLHDAIEYLKKGKDYRQFQQLSEQLLESLPALSDWVSKHPFKVLQYAKELPALIQATHWIRQNPRPDIYLRQITLAGMDSKLIEKHKQLLTQWWDIVLPPQHIFSHYTGIKHFEQRFGFKTKPMLIRFRILDPELYIQGLSDLSISAAEFSQLMMDVNTVFITENDINGLAFPDVAKAIILFGRGYGFDQLQQIDWLKHKKLFYWGDIDTHGFAILSQFRQHFPQTQSFLMDEDTLMTHKSQWVQEPAQQQADLEYLSHDELRLYNRLRDNQIGSNVRLEQEFIAYSTLMDQLKKLAANSGNR